MTILFLDTETTGFAPPRAGLVSVAVVDEGGRPLLDTLCNPGHRIPPQATAVHGIRDADVRTAPPAADVAATVLDLTRGHRVVIFNKQFDLRFLPGVEAAADTVCALSRLRQWRKRSGARLESGKLVHAAEFVGHDWGAMRPHGALADALALRSVWNYLEIHDVPPAAPRMAEDRRPHRPVLLDPTYGTPLSQEREEVRRAANLAAGKPARTGFPWCQAEDEALRSAMGSDLGAIEDAFERTRFALLLRMAALGLLSPPVRGSEAPWPERQAEMEASYEAAHTMAPAP